jgi:hypothetical protein
VQPLWLWHAVKIKGLAPAKSIAVCASRRAGAWIELKGEVKTAGAHTEYTHCFHRHVHE